MTANGGVSFWWQQVGLPAQRPALPGDREIDVAIVGGGYTGLWTAYALKREQPDLRIAVLEQRFAGYGAFEQIAVAMDGSVAGEQGKGRLVSKPPRMGRIEIHRRAAWLEDAIVRLQIAHG